MGALEYSLTGGAHYSIFCSLSERDRLGRTGWRLAEPIGRDAQVSYQDGRVPFLNRNTQNLSYCE
jgi:hypothetical protein